MNILYCTAQREDFSLELIILKMGFWCVFVWVCGAHITHVAGTYICLHSDIMHSLLPYGYKKQVTILQIVQS